MAEKIYLNIIWHMHQPYYYDSCQDIFTLPWVRTHATKDYLFMAKLADRFPQVRMTFNFTPSLIKQINLYLQGKTDLVWNHFEKEAKKLSKKEKDFILENFFLAPSQTQTSHFPFYETLKEKAKHNIHNFSTQDWLDLQILYQLLWFDPITIKDNPDLSELIKRGKGYTEKDKAIIKQVTSKIIAEIIPMYKKLHDKGQIEISTSPLYHPIIPLLIDNWVASESSPGTHLPRYRFQYIDDAQKQIQKAKDVAERIWKTEIRGIWPSEGSVSSAAVSCFAQNGFSWTATGEEVLFHTLGLPIERDQNGLLNQGEKLYQPWFFSNDKNNIAIFFRDRHLSDLIGFAYQHLTFDDAVKDMISNLERIMNRLPNGYNPVLSIILDGENAWEYYNNNGFDFLNNLYEALSQHSRITTTTPSEYLAHIDQKPALHTLAPGSWIYGSLNTWIGHEEKNWAWDQLFLVRRLLAEKEKELDGERKQEIFNILYQAEGSDWFWWLGPDNPSVQKEDFRKQFLSLLEKICDLIGEKYPGEG
jgi:alpha-amylase/alpha-mannosidase (GH57 family)